MNSVDNNSNTLDYCISKAIPDGSSLYYATLFEETKNKQILICLNAFLYELTDIIHECSDPGIARVKLHWWQEEIERLFQQQARHPVTKQCAVYLSLDENLKNSLNAIILSFDNFLFIEQIDSLDKTLTLYDSTAGEVWHQCGAQLQNTTVDSLKPLRELGTIYQFVRCLQKPHTYITETRCIIPKNIIKQDDLFKLQLDIKNKSGEQADIFSPLIVDLINRLEQLYKELKKNKDSNFNHALILNRIVLKTCDEIRKDGCKLLDTNTNLTPLRKLWIAWWTHFIT